MSRPKHVPVNPDDVPLAKKVVFSGFSGAIATTCIYPIDLCKTKLMNQKGVGAEREFKGPLQTFGKLWRAGGVRGLYRGWPPNVILVMPEKALKLTMNDFFRSQLRGMRAKKDLPLWLQGVAGAMAGFTQVIATNPMELLKIQGATMADKIKSGQLKAAVPYGTLIRQLGVTGMYTGVVATLIRDVPFSMLYFSLFAQSKEWLLGSTPPSEAGFFKPFLAGAMAGTVAAAATCPMDVIKTRVHAEAKPERIEWSKFMSRERHLLLTHTRTVIGQEGYSALFKGLIPRCAIISPLFAITMGCYDKFQQNWG